MLKSLVLGSRKYATAMGITFFFFGVFALVWFYVLNRYTVLYYQEQMQLFRFDRFYFFSFLDRPGGLVKYIGAFLTQFYFYPFAGAMILTIVITTVVLLFYSICRTSPQPSSQGRELKSCGNIRQWFFIAFIPAVLLMTSFVNIFFDMSAALAILLVLAGFRWYMGLPLPIRYGAGLMLVTAIYFIAGGNALLLAAMILIFESTGFVSQKEPAKKRNKWLYLLLLAGWTALLPWLSWRLLYTITIREACFALTPANFLFPSMDSKLLWLSIPTLFFIVRLMGCKTNRWNLSPMKAGVFNFLMVSGITVYCAYTMYDRKSDTVYRMAFELQHGNFDSVLALGKSNLGNNHSVCYLSNIALYESGQMPDRMFQYKQMSTAGLLPDWKFEDNDILTWHPGEVYYRLGMTLQAEHAAFEALVLNRKEPDVTVLQRLALTNMARRDAASAGKYLRYLDHSLFYRKWAQQQHEYLARAMADSTFRIPDTPIPAHCKDFFISYQIPEYTLLMLLEANPKHRMAFEYLMAYCMLQKDLQKVKWCMDNYYVNFDYPAIPTHYEEALLLYKSLFNEDADFFTQYPVSNATQEDYNRYLQAVTEAAQGNKDASEELKKQFSHTYWWYYMIFTDPSTIKK